jgi:transcriptional regulator with XRE-family HTH domain
MAVERPLRLTPERARALRKQFRQSLDLVALATGENTPTLSKWERGLIPPGKVWDRVARKLAAYLVTQERLARVVTPPAKQAAAQ